MNDYNLPPLKYIVEEYERETENLIRKIQVSEKISRKESIKMLEFIHNNFIDNLWMMI